jgi:hypothetical protein
MLLTALAVRLDSPGPILYRQERVGENGRLFTLYKFRSMRTDAEQGTPIWATQSDNRITRIGRVLRLTRLDELPQFWNVLRGEMSFVGPRPERPFFVQQLAELIPFYMARHAIKPGLTGWAQGPLPVRLVGRGRAREAALRPVLHETPVARLRPHDSHGYREGNGVPERRAVSDTAPPSGAIDTAETLTVARNVSTRYLAIGIEALLGLVVLPFNIAHLGTSAYGLWMLTASITAYFSVLDMGYSGALVKFVAEYRARTRLRGAERDPEHDLCRVRGVRRPHLRGGHRDRAVARTHLHPVARTSSRRADRAAHHQPERGGPGRPSTCSAASSTASSATTSTMSSGRPAAS